jgi:hypothetical protein
MGKDGKEGPESGWTWPSRRAAQWRKGVHRVLWVEWIMPVIAFPAEPFNWSVSVGDELD